MTKHTAQKLRCVLLLGVCRAASRAPQACCCVARCGCGCVSCGCICSAMASSTPLTRNVTFQARLKRARRAITSYVANHIAHHATTSHAWRPPPQGFVSNKTSEAGDESVDPLEPLLYSLLVANSARLDQGRLGDILGVSVQQLALATSVAVRLGFASRVGGGGGGEEGACAAPAQRAAAGLK